MVYQLPNATKIIKTPEEYGFWLENLKWGDRVILQEFLPHGNSMLDSVVECWRYWDCELTVDYSNDWKVHYNSVNCRINKEGFVVYYGVGDVKYGQVFNSRIIPYHYYLVNTHKKYLLYNKPVWDEDWYRSHRCVIKFTSHHWNQSLRQLEQNKELTLNYCWEVDDGKIFVIFAKPEVVKDFIADKEDFQWLYSEYLK
jgi:hypothetical protein